ncbi:diaminopimelate epimerase [Candidatus Pantoea edessiphila]|uniref:Diaminopimelate epimerase n=1 Tax=Candidatus Pantoea edessiphila TaxID=2044610 RepID=A0A2P5SXD7_9GAMM|nr:diaminopimelate epimerase [Candidatus Pantoea edessiphila]MBK4775823.1 diaminopimelate epimerase [Pantoea sp. Edef]PPI86996.1 diaminopimelate epimerase [Candidatus Pantoea edessiphila]
MKFSKMHGLGNDFVIIDATRQNVSLSSENIKKISDRHLGIGFDQLLIVESSHNPRFDFHYKIFNSNGSEAFQCGNGARCFAVFVKLQGLTDKNSIFVSTKTTSMILNIIKDNLVRVDMDAPNFEPSKIPIRMDKFKKFYSIKVNGINLKFGMVSVGNPHCVIQVQDITTTQVNVLGPIIEKHDYFPQSTNVNFMEVINPNRIRLRVYERGIGETYACGSGACASVACGIIQGLLSSEVQVELLGGTLYISWKGIGKPIHMTGPAIHVYDGCIHI